MITPMFAGGVYIDPDAPHMKQPDPLTPIRAASIRGQLRFWWRVARAHTCRTVDELWRREAEVWGSASAPGRVALEVIGQPEPERLEIYVSSPSRGLNPTWNPESSAGMKDYAYGGFPLQHKASQPRQTENGSLTTLQGVFTIRITGAGDLRTEAEAAVGAWLTFGGIGGRTRRGFGAVAEVGDDNQPIPVAPGRFLVGANDPVGLTGHPREGEVVARSGSDRHIAAPFTDASTAHRFALRALKIFRQGVGVARPGPDARFPGRTFWPDADMVKRWTRPPGPKHPPEHSVRKFPRAAFGLPIIFHFKRGDNDGPDATLQPVGRKRLASPLFLRPIRTTGGWSALAVIIRDPGADLRTVAGPGLALSIAGAPPVPVESAHLTPAEASAVEPMGANRGFVDPLAAFLNLFKSLSL
ncbi:MAG: type III-B CRISPR module RAMP protein Cmr1 [Myxococcota bacterium]